MNHFTRERWNLLLNSAGIDIHVEFDEMLQRYSEPQRHYHNARHIDECLAEFDSTRTEALDPIAVEFAIWLHDVIYDPRANDNEEQSARLAFEYLRDAGRDLATRVPELILVTKTHVAGETADAALLIDIDLSILGKGPERFGEYERGIRAEYAWVPVKIYREKRAEILRRFLERERIFNTQTFYDRYEAAARRNIVRSIAELGGGTGRPAGANES